MLSFASNSKQLYLIKYIFSDETYLNFLEMIKLTEKFLVLF